MYPGQTCPMYIDPSGFLMNTSLSTPRISPAHTHTYDRTTRTAQFLACTGRTARTCGRHVGISDKRSAKGKTHDISGIRDVSDGSIYDRDICRVGIGIMSTWCMMEKRQGQRHCTHSAVRSQPVGGRGQTSERAHKSVDQYQSKVKLQDVPTRA